MSKKIAIVTGANRGLGFETSRQLAQKGMKVYMCARDISKGKVAADKLKAEKLDVHEVELDVTKDNHIRSFANLLKEKNETPYLIVNNAGVFLEGDVSSKDKTTSALNVDPVIILKTIEVNTMGPLRLLQAFIPLMKEKKEGRIINIASIMGSLSHMEGNWPGYRMSKTALNALTCILASELEGSGISVNSVCPGWVKTDMGGPNAQLSLKEGVQTTLWLAFIEKSPNGGFYRDKKSMAW